jgi:hypothetical protein
MRPAAHLDMDLVVPPCRNARDWRDNPSNDKSCGGHKEYSWATVAFASGEPNEWLLAHDLVLQSLRQRRPTG